MDDLHFFDIHTHVLPCVDDGSTSVEQSLELLTNLKNDGVTDVMFTPHFRLDMFLTPAAKDIEVFNSFTKLAKENGLNLNFYLGQELHHHSDMPSLIKQGKALTLNKSKYILLEFSWHVKPLSYQSIIKSYTDIGITPIVVHFERFPYFDISDVALMRDLGALFQVNAYSIFGVESAERAERVKKMLSLGYVDFIASDYHKNKKILLKDAYNFVSQEYGTDLADKLLYTNAKKLFGN